MKRHDMPYPVGGRTAVRVALATLLLAASAACSPSRADKAAGPTATVATDPPTTTTTTTNPYAVPPVIDVAYVNRVLAGLDAAVGDITRMVVRTRTIPREAYDRMRSLSSDDTRLQREIDSYQRDLRSNLTGYRPEPGNLVSVVTQMITARANCIFVQVRRDYSTVSTRPLASLEIQWIGLQPLDPSRDPYGYNPTRWVYIYEGFPPDHSQPPNPCSA